jgi:transposase InsO family protein
VADAALSTTIRQIHATSRGTYGAPRIHAELADAYETRCSRKRGARLMRAARLVGVCRRRVVRTTRREDSAPVSDDLVRRTFTAPAPNRLWVAEIVRSQMTKADGLTPGAGRDHVADHHIAIGDDHPIDQQLDQTPLLLERRAGQARLHPLAEGHYRADHSRDFGLPIHLPGQAIRLLVEAQLPLLQVVTAPVVLR